MTPREKVVHHLEVMAQRNGMTKEKAKEHLLRHFRGVLTALGDLVEEELKTT